MSSCQYRCKLYCVTSTVCSEVTSAKDYCITKLHWCVTYISNTVPFHIIMQFERYVDVCLLSTYPHLFATVLHYIFVPIFTVFEKVQRYKCCQKIYQCMMYFRCSRSMASGYWCLFKSSSHFFLEPIFPDTRIPLLPSSMFLPWFDYFPYSAGTHCCATTLICSWHWGMFFLVFLKFTISPHLCRYPGVILVDVIHTLGPHQTLGACYLMG